MRRLFTVFVSVSAADVEDQIDRGNDASLFHFSGVSDKVPVYTLDSEVSPNEFLYRCYIRKRLGRFREFS